MRDTRDLPARYSDSWLYHPTRVDAPGPVEGWQCMAAATPEPGAQGSSNISGRQNERQFYSARKALAAAMFGAYRIPTAAKSAARAGASVVPGRTA